MKITGIANNTWRKKNWGLRKKNGIPICFQQKLQSAYTLAGAQKKKKKKNFQYLVLLTVLFFFSNIKVCIWKFLAVGGFFCDSLSIKYGFSIVSVLYSRYLLQVSTAGVIGRCPCHLPSFILEPWWKRRKDNYFTWWNLLNLW